MSRRGRWSWGTLLLVGMGMVGPGCRKEFKPGVYELMEVSQVTKDEGGSEQDRSRLPSRGTALFTYDADGTYVVEMSNFGFLGEKSCSGRYEGEWEVHENKMRMTVRKSRVPRRCRPENERIYLYQMGSGSLTLERHFDENAWMHYFFEVSR